MSRALDQMAGELEVASHVTTDTSTELDISGQDTVVREVDEELDELDELDDGPWPLMTSDLDYPHDSQSADVKDGMSLSIMLYFPFIHSLYSDRKRTGLSRTL